MMQFGSKTACRTRQDVLVPTRVPGLSAAVVHVRAGGRHSLALLRDTPHTLVSWGDSSMGQLGYPALNCSEPRCVMHELFY